MVVEVKGYASSIVHQQQPDDKTCTSACIAMALGVPVQSVIDEFHGLFMHDRETPVSYLKLKGLKAIAHVSTERTMTWGYYYLLAVPSLNRERGLHSILVDTSDGKNIRVFDPQEGRARFYKDWDDVRGYVIDCQMMLDVHNSSKQEE